MVSGHVLLVEDDPDACAMLADLIAALGYDVECASNGQAALDMLAADPPPFLILIDVSMPIMDGRQFCKRKNGDARFAEIPTVIVSALADVEGQHLEDLGAAQAIVKPIDVAHLRSLLQRHASTPGI